MQSLKNRWGADLAIPYHPPSPRVESPFTQNHRLIQEHKERLKCEYILAHFRHQITKIEEGQRRRLRFVVYLDPDLEFCLVPLDPTFKVPLPTTQMNSPMRPWRVLQANPLNHQPHY